MKRILVADDEPSMLKVLKLFLERAGYGVETTGNGQAALRSIMESPPDALVTDIQMPVMTGKELCLALEQQLPHRTFPIFVMTSMTDRDHREWTQKIGNMIFLEKPLSMRTLSQRLARHFDTADKAGGTPHV